AGIAREYTVQIATIDQAVPITGVGVGLDEVLGHDVGVAQAVVHGDGSRADVGGRVRGIELRARSLGSRGNGLGGSHLRTCRLSCRSGSLYLGRGRVQRIGGTGYGS